MATSNFSTGGNGGINVIDENEHFDTVSDTVGNVVDELDRMGYTSSDSREFNDRDTLNATEVYYKGKLVAVLRVTAGYYEHANMEVYLVAGMTNEELQEQFEDLTYTYNPDSFDGWVVDRSLFTRDKRHAKKVMDAVEEFTTKLRLVGVFSSGEAVYETV